MSIDVSTIAKTTIPHIGIWKSKVLCSCPLESRINPRKLKFLLDQRTIRRMSIGKIDSQATMRNLEILRNRSNRHQSGKDAEASTSQDQLSQSEESSDALQRSGVSEASIDSNQEEQIVEKSIISASACKLQD